MAKVVLFLSLFLTAIVALGQPAIGIAAGYVISVFGPQFIWSWAFDGVRPFLWVLLPTVIGWSFGVLSGRLSLSGLSNPYAKWFGIWWLFTALSLVLGPFVGKATSGQGGQFIPSVVFTGMSTQFTFMFMAMVAIRTIQHTRWIVYVLVFSVVYFTYWANDQYLSGSVYGRLGGPKTPMGQSLYKDENTFAMMFVIGIPFIFYLGLYMRKMIYRLAIWAVIPLAWHAIFLTQSRGGLLGVGATMAYYTVRAKRYFTGALGILAFIGIFLWQGGDMINRADTVATYEEDKSAVTRLEAWTAAIRMVGRWPIAGVGVGAFQAAFPSVAPEFQARATHNTIFEIAAESGIMAGVGWIMIVWLTAVGFGPIIKKLRALNDDSDDVRFITLMSEACMTAMVGFAVCSIFLSLKGYEAFFLLGVVAAALRALAEERIAQGATERGAAAGPARPPPKHQASHPLTRHLTHPDNPP